MIFVKLAILLWIAFFIVRFFVRANVTLEEKVVAANIRVCDVKSVAGAL